MTPARMTPARLVASGCGAGFAPVAPGTAGSLVGLALGASLLWAAPAALPWAGLAATLGGLWAVRAAQIVGDPGWVVIDEVAGQLLALLPLARPTPLGLLAAFLLFRLLDIAKPGPIGWADRQGGAVAIMADDVLAGAIAAAILWAVRSHWPDLPL
jgi:phosphatidylglycerophosphatase A